MVVETVMLATCN